MDLLGQRKLLLLPASYFAYLWQKLNATFSTSMADKDFVCEMPNLSRNFWKIECELSVCYYLTCNKHSIEHRLETKNWDLCEVLHSKLTRFCSGFFGRPTADVRKLPPTDTEMKACTLFEIWKSPSIFLTAIIRAANSVTPSEFNIVSAKISLLRKLLKLASMHAAERFIRAVKMGGQAFLFDVSRSGQRPLTPIVAVSCQDPVDRHQLKRNNTSLASISSTLRPMPVVLTEAYEPFRSVKRLLQRKVPHRTCSASSSYVKFGYLRATPRSVLFTQLLKY